MFELEWYSNRVVSIDPIRKGDTFNGKIIGVSDYGDSNSDHTLVVEIKSPSLEEQNIYLTYNRAEGINADTGEHGNKITIVYGGVGERSHLFAALDDTTTSHTISNFYSGRDLFINVQNVGSDGTVDYATVTVELEIETCTNDSDCNVGTSGCFTATCDTLSGKCVYNAVTGCCGNGICEPEVGENCGSCSADCIKPDHCNDVGYYLGGCTGVRPILFL